MKNSDEWASQARVDEAADAIVAQTGCSISDVRGYRVAKALNCSAGGELYDRVRDWRGRRHAEAAVTMIEVPAAAETAFREFLERASAETMAMFIQTVRSVGTDLDRAATLRTADGDRRAAEAEKELGEVVKFWRAVETDLAAAQARIAALEQALRDAQRREDRLLGRLEQRGVDAASDTREPPAMDMNTDQIEMALGSDEGRS